MDVSVLPVVVTDKNGKELWENFWMRIFKMEKIYQTYDNISIFKDTQMQCISDPYLKEAIRKTNENQEFISEEMELEETENYREYENSKIIISGKRTLEAAKDYPGKKVCVLNFADALIPGGMVFQGAATQEETICRCSTLYESIARDEMVEKFYKPHRKLNFMYNDDIIYTPEVIVFREDTLKAEVLPKEEWYPVDVITCAAPNLGAIFDADREIISRFELMLVLGSRIERILEVAKKKGNEVLILGAFGCGAFYNPPEMVAEAFKESLEKYGKYFETVEFSIYCPKKETRNYKIFKEILEKTEEKRD